MLLHVPPAPSTPADAQRTKKQTRPAAGRAVEAVVTSVHPLYIIATLANGVRLSGRHCV